MRHLGRAEWLQFQMEAFNWRMSQFLHGEQGALLCTGKIVVTTPWIDAKYYAASQVMDEARHVEVFARYLDTKLDGHYPVNANLQLLIDDVLGDSRWDMTYMGMQIMIEGLALAAFGFMHHVTQEPLLKQLLRYVMSDEARHVAFGVLSLQEYYEGLVRPQSPRAPGVRVRGRAAHARPADDAGGLGAHGHRPAHRSPRRCSRSAPRAATRSRARCSPRSCPTARSSACSTPATAGSARGSPRSASSSTRTRMDTGEEYALLDMVAADRRDAAC